MNYTPSMHQFAEAATAQIPGLRSRDCELTLVQEPESCKVSVGKEKDRKPVDPPPVVQLKISHISDPNQNYLQSPYFFVTCSLYGHPGSALAGTVVSSLHRLKDLSNNDGAFFVFGDLSVKLEGFFRLQFDLYEMQGQHCAHVGAVVSKQFTVYSSKNFQGMAESTALTRSFSEQGVRLRLRKEPRSLLKPKGPAADDYKPRHYRTGPRSRTSQTEGLPSPISPEVMRLSQGEQVDPQGYLVHASHAQPPRQLSRSYSHQSEQSYGSSTPYDEPSAKRPRTGSGHGQSQPFGQQNQPLDNTQYQSGGMYSESQTPVFTPLAQQTSQQTYGFPYAQSPQDTTRDHYFPQRSSNQIRSSSYSDANAQMSPQDSQFPPQPQAVRIHQQSGYYASSQMMHPPQRSQTDYAATGFTSRSFVPQNMGIPGMASPDWGRVNTDPAYTQSAGISSPSERQGYETYPNQNPNISAGSTMGGMSTERTMSISSAPPPGSLGGPY